MDTFALILMKIVTVRRHFLQICYTEYHQGRKYIGAYLCVCVCVCVWVGGDKDKSSFMPLSKT